jgi:hypothetical protein
MTARVVAAMHSTWALLPLVGSYRGVAPARRVCGYLSAVFMTRRGKTSWSRQGLLTGTEAIPFVWRHSLRWTIDRAPSRLPHPRCVP